MNKKILITALASLLVLGVTPAFICADDDDETCTLADEQVDQSIETDETDEDIDVDENDADDSDEAEGSDEEDSAVTPQPVTPTQPENPAVNPASFNADDSGDEPCDMNDDSSDLDD